MDHSLSFSSGMADEYEKLIRRMNPSRVVIDNEASKNATVIRVDSALRHRILLDVVQVLTDLDLIFTKAYISSDGCWFMDVFNVTDQEGNKISDEWVLDCIERSLGPDSCFTSYSTRHVGFEPYMDMNYPTILELTGLDRPGLLSEVCAVLADHKCNVVNAEVWTHKTRAAAIIHVTDEETMSSISDPSRLSEIKSLLSHVLKGKIEVSRGFVHDERRIHQMMLADRDFERSDDEGRRGMDVRVVDWHDKDYSFVTVRCKDRPKLVFDTVCTLTDMDYVVFHANVDVEGSQAYQEYYIRHVDGSPLKSDAERQQVVQCLEAAIERRVSNGVKLELCTTDRVGLLSDITRIFRENSLNISRAEVATKSGKAVNTFYVRGISGGPVDSKIIETIREVIGQTILKVKGITEEVKPESPTRFLFGGLFKSRSFVDLICLGY